MPDQDSPAPRPAPAPARTLWSQTLERWLLRRPAMREPGAAGAASAKDAGADAPPRPSPAWADPLPLAA